MDDLFIEKFISNYTYEYKGEEQTAKVRKEKIFIKGTEVPHTEEVIEVGIWIPLLNIGQT